MTKFSREFFQGGKVLFAGYSEKSGLFCSGIYKALSQNGFIVYPLNNKPGGNYDVKVFTLLSELPEIPENAYILTNKDNTKNIIGQLAKAGVKRILFQSRMNVYPETLKECEKLGLQTSIACPMMVYGSGFHKFHAFFAGIR
jgi:acyl-CoA synthetase (NDP forming)